MIFGYGIERLHFTRRYNVEGTGGRMEVCELDGVAPLCFRVGSPERPLPVRLDGRGIHAELDPSPHDGTVVVNFLYYPDLYAYVDGQPAVDRVRLLGAGVIRAAAGSRRLDVLCQPPWSRGLLLGSTLLGLGFLGMLLLERTKGSVAMPRETFWDGKSVWITGATSGIGRALAGHLAPRGAKLGLIARREDVLDEVARSVRAAGGDCAWAAADVADARAVAAAAGTLQAALGPCDVLVANAGIYRKSPVREFDPVKAQQVVATNLQGTLNAIAAVLPDMIRRQQRPHSGDRQHCRAGGPAGRRRLPGEQGGDRGARRFAPRRAPPAGHPGHAHRPRLRRYADDHGPGPAET